MKTLRRGALLALLCAFFPCSAGATNQNWAAPQIRAVTQVGILGTSASSFAPQSPLTQSALAAAVATADALQHTPAPKAAPPVITSTVGPDATIAGSAPVDLEVTGADVDHVDFAVDGFGISTAYDSPYELDLETTQLTDGPHALAANVSFVGGGNAIVTWNVTVANSTSTPPTAPGPLVPLTIAKLQLPTPVAPTGTVAHTLYRATAPDRKVTVKQLDAALVAYAGLGAAAREIQATLTAAGLAPPANTGTEAVARMLGLRLNHPAAEDALELLPNQAVTRAETAYSFAQLIALSDTQIQQVQAAADAFTLPTLTSWQQRILTTAVHYVGYPYIWGGTSPTAETLFGVHSVGGFDCSGFVWRVYKLTPYAGEGNLANVLRGRTTYVMSGEVPKSKRITAANLQPGDVMFFGAHGTKSVPTEVDHTALYLGNGWFVQSSSAGVTLLPFAGYYADRFAWGRRPLREAGLNG